MALHGLIQVNGVAIGHWSAVRDPDIKFKDPKPGDIVPYYCEVAQATTLEGHPAIRWEGIIQHCFGDGALALAAEVLSQAFKYGDNDTWQAKRDRLIAERDA